MKKIKTGALLPSNPKLTADKGKGTTYQLTRSMRDFDIKPQVYEAMKPAIQQEYDAAGERLFALLNKTRRTKEESSEILNLAWSRGWMRQMLSIK